MTFFIVLGYVFALIITFLMYAMCYVFENDLDQELFIQKLKEQKHGK